jgi:2-oxoglutarate ferredoxin oxidoreductase subunit gamma
MLRLRGIKEIRVAGFGGQGVIMAASVIGRAATIHENLFATMTQSFGPESRGGACAAQCVVSDEPVLYPYVTHPNILVTLSQEAYNKFHHEAREGTILIVEEDLVRLTEIPSGARVFSVPATRLAEEIGKKMVANIVVVGFFAAVTQLMNAESFRKAVAESVPAHFQELNLKAFDKGYQFGMESHPLETLETLAPLES